MKNKIFHLDLDSAENDENQEFDINNAQDLEFVYCLAHLQIIYSYGGFTPNSPINNAARVGMIHAYFQA